MLTDLGGHRITLADLAGAYRDVVGRVTSDARQKTAQAKATLKKLGWTNRSAAAVIGCTYQHLSCVLNGHRVSRRVLMAIEALPKRRPS
jgi:hypothetical protein